MENTIDEQRMLSNREKCRLFGISTTTDWRLRRTDPDYPQPVLIGNALRTPISECLRYIELLKKRAQETEAA